MAPFRAKFFLWDIIGLLDEVFPPSKRPKKKKAKESLSGF
jgi:hypothetical protein